MTTAEAYERTLLKLDAVATESIALDKGSFCYYFNDSQNQLIENFIQTKTDENIRYIQKILTTKNILSNTKTQNLYQDFSLPEKYFEFSSVRGIASNNICKNVMFDLYEIKNQNKDVILTDEYNKPSFLYREAPFYIGNDTLNVYVDDTFSLSEIILDYYRYPVQIQLIDPENFESDFDETSQCEFDDRLVNRIITNTVSLIQLGIKDGTFATNRQKSVQKI